MTLTSPSYFFFLLSVYVVFHFSPDRFRWVVLLVASYLFYATFESPLLPAVLVLVTAISYACGIRIGRITDPGRRARMFRLGVAACVLILALMKYLPAVASVFGGETGSLYATPLITVGVSYFTFQAISYLADIYLETQEPETHPGYHALSLAFFPKLLQGPIERAGALLPQLRKAYVFDYDAVRSGMLLFAWGLFRKLVVADRLALYVNQVYGDVGTYAGPVLLLATYAYALQIYFDFAGYTDMARGTARMFGIDLAENFNSPYLATSVADFWRRWHMSFSRWILDYIFKPLQIAWRYSGKAGTALALVVTFLISGIWHGASWGFVVWGLLHGVFMGVAVFYRPYQVRFHRWLGVGGSRWLKAWQVFATFHLVTFAWVFFRADNVGDAWYIINRILAFHGDIKTKHNFTMISVALFITLLVTLLRNGATQWMNNKTFRWAIYILLIHSIILCGVHKGDSFVYFKY
jgi:alginate O-acetyltransferase complex protein AlgI